MRRLVVLVVIAIAACDVSDSPTTPLATPATVPSFAFGGGSGKVLASTNAGELVEIDLSLATATLIGDVGTFDGDELGWTDIATDASGRLFAMSRVFTESDFEVHLYEIDQTDGSVVTDIGSAGDHTFSDFDFDGSVLYGSGASDVFLCCGQLFTMDAGNAQTTWISSDTLGFGLNPFDTVNSVDPIARGGFAVHPTTGDFGVSKRCRVRRP